MKFGFRIPSITKGTTTGTTGNSPKVIKDFYGSDMAGIVVRKIAESLE